MAIGRPTDYNDEIGALICERLCDGESLKSICSEPEMPARSTVFRWLTLNKIFSDMYTKAREVQADALADELLAIADDGRNDWMERIVDGENLGWKENGESIRRSALRVDTRKWIASKLKPRKYSERLMNEHTGADGGAIKTESTTTLSDNDVARQIAFALAKGLQEKKD